MIFIKTSRQFQNMKAKPLERSVDGKLLDKSNELSITGQLNDLMG